MEGLLRHRLVAAGLGDQATLSSAGVFALQGEPACPRMAALLAMYGIDLSAHRARSIYEGHLLDADLILVMEEAHRRSLFHRQPQRLQRVYLLSELAGEHADLPDPSGRSDAEYRRVITLAEHYLGAGWSYFLRV